jgi:hypothetical protein
VERCALFFSSSLGFFCSSTAPIWVPIVGVLGLVGVGTAVVGGIEASHAARQDVSAVTEPQSTSDQTAASNQVKGEAVTNAEQLATESAAIEESTQQSASVPSIPNTVPTAPVGPPATQLGLPGALNDTFRGMLQKTVKHCNAITDHVWVTPEHVSVMCDRRLRAAFIHEADSWRFGRPGE